MFRRQSGSTWSRAVAVRNLSQGQELIRAEPRGSRRYHRHHGNDMRLEKMLAAHRSAGFAGSIYVKASNLANSGVATAVVSDFRAIFRSAVYMDGPANGLRRDPGNVLTRTIAAR